MTEENQDTQPVETGFLPDMTAVESSNINAVGYDAATGSIAVEFKDGVYWRYHGVSASVFTDMMQADSIGAFFHANIKGQYTSEKWDAEASTWTEGNTVGQEDTAPATEAEEPAHSGDDVVRSDSGAAHPMEAEAQEDAAAGNATPETSESAPTESAPPSTEASSEADDAQVKALKVNMTMTVKADTDEQALADWLLGCPYAVKIEGTRDINLNISNALEQQERQAA